jgi:hypothetical protein
MPCFPNLFFDVNKATKLKTKKQKTSIQKKKPKEKK